MQRLLPSKLRPWNNLRSLTPQIKVIPQYWLIAVCTIHIFDKIIAEGAENSDEIRKNQLKLALTWDRADIAQEEIFREDVFWPKGKKDHRFFFIRV